MNRSSTSRDWVKLALAASVEGTGLGAACRTVRTWVAGARIHVLGYHRVVDRIDATGPISPSLCITTDAFAAQMEQLRARFVVLPLSYVVRAVAGDIEVPHDAVAVTFDDGYRDVLLRAAPILRALDIPATVFVPTGFSADDPHARVLPHDRLYAAVWAARNAGHTLTALADSETAILLARADRRLAVDGPVGVVDELIETAPATLLEHIIDRLEERVGVAAASLLDDGAAVLSPDEVRTLADGGWEIGAHTVGHVVLTHESPLEMRRQLAASKADLERWSGRPCRYFAYCNGYHSPSLVAELRRAGYEGAVTTCDRPNAVGSGDPFRISRKVLWDAHARSPRGEFSPALSAAHLHDLFGTLGLTTPVNGEMAPPPAAPHFDPNPNPNPNPNPLSPSDSDPQPPTEVELAY